MLQVTGLIDVIATTVATRTEPMRAARDTRQPSTFGATPVAGFSSLSSEKHPFDAPPRTKDATEEAARAGGLEKFSDLRPGIAIRHLPHVNSDDNEPLKARRINPPIPSDSGWNRRSRRRRLEFRNSRQ